MSLLSVGGSRMKTGGYARLSISFLSDSDSIQRKTRIAGETMTTTDSQNPMRRNVRRARAFGADRTTGGAVAASVSVTPPPTWFSAAHATTTTPAPG